MISRSVSLYRAAYSGLSPEIWWLALVMFINRSGTMVIPFLTVYLTSRGFSLEQAGYVMGAFGAGAILGGYLGGMLTDRFGHFHVQVWSLFLNGIMFLFLSKMETFTGFISCIFILATIGESFRPANSAAIAVYSNPSNRTRCYSLNRLAINLGWAIGPAAGGLIAGKSYHLLFWADGITCMTAAILLYFLFRKKQQKETGLKQEQHKQNLMPAWKDRPFMLGMLFIFLVGLCFFQMFSIMPVFYKENLQLKEFTIGWLLALNGLLIALTEMVLVYKLENKYDSVFLMMGGSLLIAASFLILNIYPALAVALVSMIIITAGEMLLFPFMNNFWVNRSREYNRGQYAAIYTMSFSAAIVLAPTLASQLAGRAGFSVLWLADAGICLLAVIGFYYLRKIVAKDESLQKEYPDPLVRP